MQRALLTGSGGFVGRSLTARLAVPCEALRLGAPGWEGRLEAAAFAGATVFHLAGRVHSPGAGGEDAYLADNVEKTRRLGESAARQGARRLVFLSTIKVHGEQSPGRPFRVEDAPSPQDAYARSKLAAEQALARIASETGLSVTIVRAPVVFGAGAKGNLAALLRLADTPWPLPFAALAGRRSFVHVDDLACLLVACGEQAAAGGRTFIAAHSASFTTPELVSSLRRALSRPERLYSVSPALLESAAAVLGQGANVRRLTRSLEADPAAAERELGWNARIGLGQAAEEMARAWRAKGPS